MSATDLQFDEAGLVDALSTLDAAALDQVPFGVVGLDDGGHVVSYNRWEAELSGLDPDRVRGQHFFTQVAPCTNNFMVAERFGEAQLDEVIDYVFTFRMQPTSVRLRMIVAPAGRFLCVERS